MLFYGTHLGCLEKVLPISTHRICFLWTNNVATGKRGCPHNIFLISPRKYMLWVLIRSASARHF